MAIRVLHEIRRRGRVIAVATNGIVLERQDGESIDGLLWRGLLSAAPPTSGRKCPRRVPQMKKAHRAFS